MSSPKAESPTAGTAATTAHAALVPKVDVSGNTVTITINAPPNPAYGGTVLTGDITGPDGGASQTLPMTQVPGTTNQVRITVPGPGSYTATVTCSGQSVTVPVTVS